MNRPWLSQRDLDTLLSHTEQSIRRDLLRVIQQVQAGIPLSRLEQAILEKNVQTVIDVIGLEPVQNALARAQTSLQTVREAGWFDAVSGLPPKIQALNTLQLSLGAHAQQSPFVLDRIRQQDLTRIRQVTQETREAIRYRLSAGLELGEHPSVIARKLRDTVGLNRQQARILERFHQQLVKDGRDPAQVERMAARRAQQLATVRAENIARTEVIRSLNEGKQAQWKRLTDAGVINPDQWEQEWRTALDERTCPTCEPLNGERAPIGGFFSSDIGLLSGPPAHPRCRCVVTLTLAGFRSGSEPSPLRRRILAGIGT